MKLEFSRQILEKSSDIEFNQNPSSGRRGIPCRQTDGQIISRTRLESGIILWSICSEDNNQCQMQGKTETRQTFMWEA